jgi:hypothetical protein
MAWLFLALGSFLLVTGLLSIIKPQVLTEWGRKQPRSPGMSVVFGLIITLGAWHSLAKDEAPAAPAPETPPAVTAQTQAAPKEEKAASPPSKGMPKIGKPYVVTSGYPACTSRKYIEELISYLQAGDKEAARKLETMGACGAPDNRSRVVYVEELFVWDDLAKVRRRGSRDLFWVLIPGLDEATPDDLADDKP